MYHPLQLKLIRIYFSVVSRYIPSLSVISAHRLFHYPINSKRKNRNEVALPPAHKFKIPLYEKIRLQGYQWGDTSHPKVLLVHGWSTTSRSMTHFIDILLKQNYQVISYDALRHGESTGSFSDLASWADSLQAVMQHIGQVECIVAHSFGGAAVTVASKLGLETKKLVLVAPIHDISSVADNFAKHLHIPMNIVKEMRSYTWKQNKKHFSKYGSNWHDIVISDFHVPTLLFHDKQDKEIGIEHSKQICKMWPWARLVTTEGLGHRSILDDDEVAEKMLEFIQHTPTQDDKENL
jgi:pimeloyl-ACP methyl ester carboxylesterase